jgi:hypothetical protein
LAKPGKTNSEYLQMRETVIQIGHWMMDDFVIELKPLQPVKEVAADVRRL